MPLISVDLSYKFIVDKVLESRIGAVARCERQGLTCASSCVYWCVILTGGVSCE